MSRGRRREAVTKGGVVVPDKEMTFGEAIKVRKSIRTYADRVLDAALQERIGNILKEQGKGPFGNTPRFALVEKGEARTDVKVRLGTYGVIKGVRYFLAGAMARGENSDVDYGYLFERVILEMTRLGLGTCWLGGTFSRKEWGQVLKMGDEAYIPSISALGFGAERPGAVDRIVRWSARGDKRKPWADLFTDGGFRHALTQEAAGDHAVPLEMVRLAPSASNKQPWRVVKGDRCFHFYLGRNIGYGAKLFDADLQKVDMGIAMCHFELTAKEEGLPGLWRQAPPCITPPRSTEYVITWFAD